MGALIGHLQTMLARGDSEIDVVRAIEDELTGGDLLDEELSDEGAAVREALRREHEMRTRLVRVSAKLVLDDLRRAELELTLQYAHRGGIYLPGELDQLEPTRGSAWSAREAVRFAAFTTVANQLIARMESGRLRAEDYGSAVTELAARLSRVPMHMARRR